MSTTATVRLPVAAARDSAHRHALAARLLSPRDRLLLLLYAVHPAQSGQRGDGADFIRAGCRVATINECLMWAIMALGLNVVVGYAGLLDLGYRGVLGDRWLHRGLADGRTRSTGPSTSTCCRRSRARAPGIHINFWLVLRHRRHAVRAARHHHRRPDAAAAQRLPGPGHARLRRDHPEVFHNGDNIAGQNVTNGTQGITPVDPMRFLGVRPDRRAAWSDSAVRNVCEVPHLLRPRRAGHVRLAADPRGPARPGLAGHPRGRAGGEHDGRAADADQAARVRHRRGRRRHRRRRVRRPRQRRCCRTGSGSTSRSRCWRWSCSAAWATSGASRSARFMLAWMNSNGLKQIGVQIDALVRHRPAGQLAALQLPHLRPAPGADDAVPPGGPDPRAPDPAGAARAGPDRGRGARRRHGGAEPSSSPELESGRRPIRSPTDARPMSEPLDDPRLRDGR